MGGDFGSKERKIETFLFSIPWKLKKRQHQLARIIRLQETDIYTSPLPTSKTVTVVITMYAYALIKKVIKYDMIIFKTDLRKTKCGNIKLNIKQLYNKKYISFPLHGFVAFYCRWPWYNFKTYRAEIIVNLQNKNFILSSS